MAPVGWILLVEDEPDHRLLLREALGRVATDVPVHEVGDGKEAISWMRKRAADPEALRGGIVILDLGLPRASGFQVLEWMREMPMLERTPVVVLTASENPMDADHAFNLGARGYFQKPTDFRRYLDIFRKVFQVTMDADPDGGQT